MPAPRIPGADVACSQCGSEGAAKICSRCSQAVYCSRECQVAAYPSHKSDCRAWALQSSNLEARAIAEPYAAPFSNAFEKYAKSVAAEVAMIAWRSAFELGRVPLNRTHYPALRFQHNAEAPALRQSFKLLQADVLSIEEEMNRRKHLSKQALAQGMPQEEDLTGGLRRQLEDRRGETLSATTCFIATDPKGKQASCTFTDVSVHIKDTWIYAPLESTKLNPQWERTLKNSLSSDPGLPTHGLVRLDFIESEVQQEERRVRELGLPYWERDE